jgi:hypothetical protein
MISATNTLVLRGRCPRVSSANTSFKTDRVSPDAISQVVWPGQLSWGVLWWHPVWRLSWMPRGQWWWGMIQLLVFRLSSLFSVDMPNVAWGGRSDATSAFFLTLSPTHFLGSRPFWGSLLRWPTPPHWKHKGHSVLQCLIPGDCGPLGNPVAAFAASSLKFWLSSSLNVREEGLLHFSVLYLISECQLHFAFLPYPL